MATNEEWLKRDNEFLAEVLPRATNIVLARGKGSYVWDVEENKFLDFTSGIGVTSIGHCHPKIVEAIRIQTGSLIHTSITAHNKPTIQLAERLNRLTPFLQDPQTFFCNSGAEAVDGAIKLARMVTGKPGIIAFKRAFHGRTYAAISLTTAKSKYQQGYTPLMGGIQISDYGDFDLSSHSPEHVGMMIVEPVLGEGGYVVPPNGWLQHLRNYCDQHNILLVFDEVQTGIGRTGHMWAAQTFAVFPDVLLFAKGIASGLPLGGIIASRSTMEKWPTGTHGSTFGGNPISCAAALATLDATEPLFPRVREKGQEVLVRLNRWKATGIGYMIRIPCTTEKLATNLQKFCLENRLLVLTCGPEGEVIRLIPPFTASDEEWEMALGILELGMKKCLVDDVLKYSTF